MNNVTASQGYHGIGKEWAERLSTGNADWVIAFNNSDCLIEYWEPRDPDTQLPHDRDEVYVITSGSSDFDMNGEIRSVVAGDAIFVPAGMRHRFLKTSDDLAMWIIFFGKRHEGFNPTP